MKRGFFSMSYRGDIDDCSLARIAEDYRQQPREHDVASGVFQKAMVAALLGLTQYGVPADIQELLVAGNPQIGVPPGALAHAIRLAISSHMRGNEK